MSGGVDNGGLHDLHPDRQAADRVEAAAPAPSAHVPFLASPPEGGSGLAIVDRAFAGWGFPAFALPLLAFYELLMLAMLALPVSNEALGAFAEDFKTWCFGYDPATGESQPMYVAMMVGQAPALAGIVAAFWWVPLRDALRGGLRPFLPHTAAAFVVVVAMAAGFGLLGTTTPATSELPFPAERLRTTYQPPQFALTDHDGREVKLADLKGKVVLVTAVYATCGYTCPMIMCQAKRAVAGLTEAERGDLAVVGITLDPERDTPAMLAKMAQGQGVQAPLFRLATGEPATVNAVLDQLGVTRKRDPTTGVIDHANLFLLIDRQGRIAYRFSLGERQERWLDSALRLLLAESNPVVG